jgi:hypothetical protein
MMGNYHVRFLGGKGAERPLTYPVCLILSKMKGAILIKLSKYIIGLAVLFLSCYAFAQQNSVGNSPSNKTQSNIGQSVPEYHGTKNKNAFSSTTKTLAVPDKKNKNATPSTTLKTADGRLKDDRIIIEVANNKKQDDTSTYGTIVAIGIPLFILFVTNIVTLYKIRAESKAAIKNELSMNIINIKKQQLSQFYDPIIALLNTNSEIFSSFGPHTFPEDPYLGEEALHIWDILVDKVILPNNTEIVTIIKKSSHLMSEEDNFELYLNFMKHALSYEAFRDTPNQLHANFSYPKDFYPNVKKYRNNVLDELRKFETKIE